MADLDLTAAIEAAAERIKNRDVAEAAVRAAAPHIRRAVADAIAAELETMCSCGPDRPDLLAECEFKDAAAVARRHGAAPTAAPSATESAQEGESVASGAGGGTEGSGGATAGPTLRDVFLAELDTHDRETA